MEDAKLSSALREKIAKSDGHDLLDVIIELRSDPVETSPSGDRKQAIAARKIHFIRVIEPVEDTVQKLGGKVLGHAWINRTIHAQVPADGIDRISNIDQVNLLDLPHPLSVG